MRETRLLRTMPASARFEQGPGVRGEAGAEPVALLLAWSEENRGRYALSVLLAVIGVAGSIVPYNGGGADDRGRAGRGALTSASPHVVGGVAAAGYAGYIVPLTPRPP